MTLRHFLTHLVLISSTLLHTVSFATAQVERGPWAGAVTSSSANVKAKVAPSIKSARLAVSLSPQLLDPMLVPAQAPGANQIVSFELRNLKPGVVVHYALETDGRLDLEKAGRFTTFPASAASFKFVFSGCAATGSASTVFDTIWAHEPLFFLHTGDLHYENIAVNNPQRFRDAFDSVLGSPTQAALYRSTAIAYIWDDHDYGPNDSDRTAHGREAARAVYQEYVPHYPLAAGSGNVPVYQAFSVARTRFIMTDLRSERDPQSARDNESKTMLGAAQKEWFKKELLNASKSHALIFWVSTVPWTAKQSGGVDHWGGYSVERREVADFIKTNKISNLVILAGDAHMLAADDGANSDYATGGGAPIPTLQAASLARTPSIKGGPWSQGTCGPTATEGGFGIVEVIDKGHEMLVKFTGRTGDDQVRITLDKTFSTPPAAGH